MWMLPKRVIEVIKSQYPTGTRVKLVHMADPYNTSLTPGCKGTVRMVDDMATIHVVWDCGSTLGIAYGVDSCVPIKDGLVGGEG